MMRRSLYRLGVHPPVESTKRIGIFPLHLDPPTRQHKSILQRLLIKDGFSDRSTPPLDHIILVPNTRFNVTIHQSVHLASMATLATRDLENVSVELAALEKPDPHLPTVQRLLRQYKNTELLHWLPDLDEVGLWTGFHDWVEMVPLCVLKPRGFGQAAESKVQRILSKLNYKSCQLIEVDRLSGSEVRQALWDGSKPVEELIDAPVLQYMRSHGMYHDFRRGRPYYTVGQRFQPTVAFQGTIPRLELHYNAANLLAREQYEKLKAFEVRPGEHPDLIVPIGGDGFMMQTIRAHWHRFVPFFGVNAGHVGYLLNDASTLEELLSAPLRLHTMCMLYVRAEHDRFDAETEAKIAAGANAQGMKNPAKRRVATTTTTEDVAFNDAWLERDSGQTALLKIRINGHEKLRSVRGDGILVSTAAGSTAYAQALGASPVPVSAPLMQLVGSNVVSPPQWKPAHLQLEDVVEVEVIDPVKRRCRGFVDSVNIGNTTRMLMRTSRIAGVQVAFCHSCDLQSKLQTLQFPKGY